MTVGDAIKELEKLDPSLPLIVPSWNETNGKARPVESIGTRWGDEGLILYGYSRMDIEQEKPLKEMALIAGEDWDHI